MEAKNYIIASKGVVSMNKRKLIIRNYLVVSHAPNKESDKKTTRLKRRLFWIFFKIVELLWMLVQIVRYIRQIFY